MQWVVYSHSAQCLSASHSATGFLRSCSAAKCDLPHLQDHACSCPVCHFLLTSRLHRGSTKYGEGDKWPYHDKFYHWLILKKWHYHTAADEGENLWILILSSELMLVVLGWRIILLKFLGRQLHVVGEFVKQERELGMLVKGSSPVKGRAKVVLGLWPVILNQCQVSTLQ